MVDRDSVCLATCLNSDRLCGRFQKQPGPILQTTGLAEQIYPGREKSPIGEPYQDKRIPPTKRDDT